MPYLIDGHNLIGRLPDISLTDPNDEALLVQKLIGFAARTGKRCFVVFDHGLPGGSSRMSTGMVRVAFAPVGVEADTIMMQRIKTSKDPGNWVVVSSDNMVLSAARRKRMQTLTSAEFAALMAPVSIPADESSDKPDNVILSPEEVEAWLKIFERRARKKARQENEKPDEKSRKLKGKPEK